MTKQGVNKKGSRDATRQARGYSYQRQHTIMRTFKSMKSKNHRIVEEGSVDGKFYEDNTVKDGDGKIFTCQIKYLAGKLPIGNFFKTVENRDNLYATSISFVVVNYNKGESYTDHLLDWKTGKIDTHDFLESIKIKHGDSGIFEKCKVLINDIGDEKFVEYLEKFTLEEGLSYVELVKEINRNIKELFKLDDDFLVLYVRYYVFDVLDRNWFGNNDLLNVDDIHEEIKGILGNIKTDKTSNGVKISLQSMIDTLKNYNSEDSGSLMCIIHELSIFTELFVDTGDRLKNVTRINKIELIIILEYLHFIYISDAEETGKLKNIYEKIASILISAILYDIQYNVYEDDELKNRLICESKDLNYYLKHKITHSIKLHVIGKFFTKEECAEISGNIEIKAIKDRIEAFRLKQRKPRI